MHNFIRVADYWMGNSYDHSSVILSNKLGLFFYTTFPRCLISHAILTNKVKAITQKPKKIAFFLPFVKVRRSPQYLSTAASETLPDLKVFTIGSIFSSYSAAVSACWVSYSGNRTSGT